MSDLIERLRRCSKAWAAHGYEPDALVTHEAADLLEANAAEIDDLRGSLDEWRADLKSLKAENEKLRAVYEAAKNLVASEYCNDRNEQPALEQAIAAVEQSEAGDELLEISGKPGTEERADLYSDDTQSNGSPDSWIPRT